jgi:hypothetical protein
MAGTVQTWFEQHESEHHHLLSPAKSTFLNIIETLGSVLKARVRNRFPSPTSLKQLEDVLQEECYKIPLQTVHSKKIAAVLKAKGGPTPH